MLSRRRFLGVGAAAALGVARPDLLLPSGLFQTGTGKDGFSEPTIRASRDGLLETTLEARYGPASAAGQVATSTVYEGSFPGPTFRVRPGDRLKVRLVNRLRDMTNLHVHGFHVSPRGNSDNVLLHVMPGQAFDYEYQIPADHPAGTYWYHPHNHGDSSEQVFGGMIGAIIIEGDLDRLPGIAGVPERLLLIQDTQLDPDGSLTPPNQRHQPDFLRLVNGQLNPTIAIRPGETQRWRIANGSANCFYPIRLDGHTFHQVGADGNTLGEVWSRDEILLGPFERAEVLIRAGAPGSYALRKLPFDSNGPGDPEAVLATMVSDGPAETPRPLPTALMPFEDLRNAQIDRRREISFQIVNDEIFQISGQPFDENRVNQTVQLGATEEWVVRNESDIWHNFHIHVNPFQVVAINGQPVQVRSFEDTVPLSPRGSITMRTRFEDYTGKFVYHCHILGHEDAGMMGIVEVVDPASAGQFNRAAVGDSAAASSYRCEIGSVPGLPE